MSNTVEFEPQAHIPSALPILPLQDSVVFPYMMVPLIVSDERLLRMADEVLAGDKTIALFAQRTEGSPVSSPADLHPVGTAASIYKMLRFPDGTMRLLVQGLARVRIKGVRQVEPYMLAELEVIPEQQDTSPELDLVVKHVRGLFQKVVDVSSYLPDELKAVAASLTNPGRLADLIASNLNLEMAAKQEILSALDPLDRLKKLSLILTREQELLELSQKIQSEVRTELDKGQREYFLRQQLKAIHKELGEGDERAAEFDDLAARIEAAGMSEEAHEATTRELERMKSIPQASAEYSVSRTYIDWFLALPWRFDPPPEIDLSAAQRVLDEDHHDLEKIKERILEYLAVLKLKPTSKGPILCFAGPPGVGKTSLGASIARALGRPFLRLSLGGMRDEAEIRGHRRTYVGALPGRIIQSLARIKQAKQTSAVSPVFMLDEVDKLGNDFRGDPASALLEVLDPAQNGTFTDLYLAVPYDLRHVFFICTANMLDTIPAALEDRMEVLDLPGYTNEQKLTIARRYLLPRQVAENGLTEERVRIPDETLRRIIADYTQEAGVRSLERQIASICRKVAREVASGADMCVSIGPGDLGEYLGAPRYFRERAEEADQTGLATGLAWTPSGGEILFIEAMGMRGNGNLQLTGNLGGVMRESALAAWSYVKAHAPELGVPADWFETHDIHIHVPGGAVPKDGPSAGVAMATALASLAAGRTVPHSMAMTGEITLRGRILPVGGIRQKVNAAHRAGILDVVMPAQNAHDLEEVPEEARKDIRFHPVSTLGEALAITLQPRAVGAAPPGKRTRRSHPPARVRRGGSDKSAQERPAASAARPRNGSSRKPR